ncbi:MAG: right-handed parallel beta-helix repeat-containing protein, partial [Armatimonadetes bacterium]|nr:right-handed parallel beta-helix repeat-containing protein [Armatimonadota bacterium]
MHVINGVGTIFLLGAALSGSVGCSRATAGGQQPGSPAAAVHTYYVSAAATEAGNGTADSPWTLERANASVEPGDTVVLLDGVYRGTSIAPARSGEAGSPITYRAANPRKAILTDSPAMPGLFPDDDAEGPAAIFLLRRSHVVIDGLGVKDPGGRFLYAGGASSITVQNCHFENTEYHPSAWESCRFKGVGDHITFRNNVVKKGNDSVAVTGGSFHLIEGNTFEGASHTCLVLMGVQRSVVRGNTFTNPIQKLMEVFTARRRDVGEEIRKSEYLLIEDNVFGPAPTTAPGGKGKNSGSAGIQYAGNDSILRRNIFVKCGMGMNFTWYECGTDEDPEALY